MGIPDQILLKPARLTPEEFEIMKTHSLIGAEAIEAAIERVVGGDRARLDELQGNTPLDFLVVARHIALGHHEKWDGSGYPQGLRGDAIPIPARLMALADVFDALTCKRHYKKAFPLEQAVALLVEGRGTHFDPDVVDAFLAIQDRFADIAERYADGTS